MMLVFSTVDARPSTESMKFPGLLLAGNFGFRDGFARDCLLQRRVHCELVLFRCWRPPAPQLVGKIASLRVDSGLAGYCATKGGVRLFAKAVAMECAAAEDGIRVNTVHPGVIDTPIWTKLPLSAGSNARSRPDARSAVRWLRLSPASSPRG